MSLRYRDRRLNGQEQEHVNRQRVLRRYKDAHFKKKGPESGWPANPYNGHRRAVSRSALPGRDIDEPIFPPWQGRAQNRVHPGNRNSS